MLCKVTHCAEHLLATGRCRTLSHVQNAVRYLALSIQQVMHTSNFQFLSTHNITMHVPVFKKIGLTHLIILK